MIPREDDWTAREREELETELERLWSGQPDEPEGSDDDE